MKNQKLSMALKNKWASGTRKRNPDIAWKKASETLKNRFACGELKPVELSSETRKKIGKINSKNHKGKVLRKTPISDFEKQQIKIAGDNFRKKDQRAQKGPQNQCSRIWRLKSPLNKIYEFKNLMHFIRENENLFIKDDVQWKSKPNRKSNFTCRAHGGLSMLCPRRKKSIGVWKGWRWFSQVERLEEQE